MSRVLQLVRPEHTIPKMRCRSGPVGIVGLSGCGLVSNLRSSMVFFVMSLLTRLQMGPSTSSLKSAIRRLCVFAILITSCVLKYLLHTMSACMIPVTVGLCELLRSVRRLGASLTVTPSFLR